MKKFFTLLIMLTAIVSVACAEEVKIYFQPNSNWKESSAWFAIYLEDNNSHSTWQKFTACPEHEGYYEVTVNTSWTKFILCRMNSGTSTMSWDTGNVWNQCPTKENRISLQNRDALYAIQGSDWSTDTYDNSLLPWKYYFVSNKTAWGAKGVMVGDNPYTYTFDGSDYADCYFAVAPGGALWADGSIHNWNQVYRVSTTKDVDVTVAFSSDFADYQVTPVTGNDGSVWKIPSTVYENAKVTVSYDGSKLSIKPSFTRNLGTVGYATFSSQYAVAIPDGVKAYFASAPAYGRIAMNKLSNGIPANTGAFLQGTGEVTFTPATSTDDASSNQLKPGTAASVAPVAASYYYVFARQGEDLGFYPTNSAVLTTNDLTGKAYLATGVSASRLSFSFDDETTGIGQIESDVQPAIENAVVYNLNGQRVVNPTKGLYIVNGKKVIIK